MTPAEHETIWSSNPAYIAVTPTVVDDARIEWPSVREFGDDWPGQEGLLDAFCGLSDAQPEGMARFVSTWGVPELCTEHGQPDYHEADTDSDRFCPSALVAGAISVRHLRQAALGVSSMRSAGHRLAVRQEMDRQDYLRIQHFVPGMMRGADRSFHGQRGFLTSRITWLLRTSRVRPFAEWKQGMPMGVILEADGLMGAVAILLARELGANDGSYLCSACGQPVTRKRPPLPGEAVYHNDPACKREQQRRNRAAWRARQRVANS